MLIQALCPVCGRSIPENRVTVRGTYGAIETQPYFDSIQWDPAKPFGMKMPANGKNSFAGWDYIDISEAPELFEALKKRFLDAIKEWVDKGWLSKKELQRIIAAVSSL